MATAVSLALARPHSRFLVLSSDPAHSLGDVAGAEAGNLARPLPGLPPNLDVREIDAAGEFVRQRDRYVASIDAAFDGLARGAMSGADASTFRQLIDLAPPGIDEVMAVAEVSELLDDEGRRYATVVSDTAPTGHALRLLQTPALLREWAQALMAILLKYQEIVRAGELGTLLVQWSRRLRGLEARLRHGTDTRFIMVTRPAALPREETVRLAVALRGLGITIGGVIVNAVGAGECPRCRARAAAEQREIERLRRSAGVAGASAMIVTPAMVPPPHGGGPLVEWASQWRRID
jgi:arsenite-transporting ATPase